MSPNGKKRGGEGSGRSSERAKLSRIITDLLDNAFSCTGAMRPYEDVESDFLKAVRCPITFSQNKYVAHSCTVSQNVNNAVYLGRTWQLRTSGCSKTFKPALPPDS